MTFRTLASAAMCLALATMAGCGDDSNPVAPSAEGKSRLLMTTTVGSSSYVGTVPDLSVSAVTTANSYEHVDKAAIFTFGDMAFVSEHWMGDKIYKYVRNDQGGLDPAGSITLPAGGQGSAMVFRNLAKAYVAMAGHGTVYIFNPTTLESLGEIDLTEYGIGDNNPDPGALVLRDDILFVGLGQNITMYSAHDGGHVAVIDADADTVIKVISDNRVTSLGTQYNMGTFRDENDDIYFYSSGVFGFQEGAHDGILRIRNGETDFDPDFYFSPRSQTVTGLPGGSVVYGMTWCYGGNGRAYSVMMVPALTSTPPDYENDKNAQPVVIDLNAGTVEKIDLPPTSMYASVGVARLDSMIVFGMSTANGDGLYTYNMNTGEASQTPAVTTVGKPQFMAVFED